MSKIIGFSGTPNKDGNVEKALVEVLKATGHEWELVRLNTKNFGPCQGCAKCAGTNRCILKDDMNEMLDKIKEADAVVIGSFPTFGRMNALTKTFTERLIPLFHRNKLTRGKIAASIAGGCFHQEAVKEELSAIYQALEMKDAGSLEVDGNASCYICGYGESCESSVLLAKYGKGARVSEDVFYGFNEDTETIEKARTLGKAIDALLTN